MPQENRPDFSEYALQIMIDAKYPFIVSFVEVVINQAVPDTPISQTQRYESLSNALMDLLARCDFEQVKVLSPNVF